jgi:hypothetical protein
MSGCNCKADKGFKVPEGGQFLKLPIKEKGKLILHYFFKVIGFLVGVALLPLINLVIIWFMFSTIVLTKEVSIIKLAKKIMGGRKYDDDEDDDEDEDDDFEELTEDDVIMVDVEDITDKY